MSFVKVTCGAAAGTCADATIGAETAAAAAMPMSATRAARTGPKPAVGRKDIASSPREPLTRLPAGVVANRYFAAHGPYSTRPDRGGQGR